jgi:hypothetical protein
MVSFDVVVSIIESFKGVGARVLLLLPLMVALYATVKAMSRWAFSTTSHLWTLRGRRCKRGNDGTRSCLSSSHVVLTTTTTSGLDFFWEGAWIERRERWGGREWRSRFWGGDRRGGNLSLVDDDVVKETLFVPS